MSIASQKTKKRTKSRAEKTPIMADSMISRQIMNSLTRFWMYCQEQSTQSGMINVVKQDQEQADPVQSQRSS